VVGLDTLAHVVKTMQDTLPTTRGMPTSNPAWLRPDRQGRAGPEDQGGIFRKQGKEIQVLDLAAQDYRPGGEAAEKWRPS
jgi:3-hydroxyacyl-CoA dehydrogenase